MARVRKPRRRRSCSPKRRHLLESLEDRRLLAVFAYGFNRLAAVGSALESHESLATPLPVVDVGIGEHLLFSELLSQIHSRIDAAVEANPVSLFEAGPNDPIETTELESELLVAVQNLDSIRVRGEQVGDLLTVQIDGSNSIESTYSLGDVGAAEGLRFDTSETASWSTEFSFHFSIEHPSSQFLLVDPSLTVAAALREGVQLEAPNAPDVTLTDGDLNLSIRLGRLDGPDHTLALTVAGSKFASADSVPEIIEVLNEALAFREEESIEFYDADNTVGIRAKTGEWTELSLFGARRLGFGETVSDEGDVNAPLAIGLLPAARTGVLVSRFFKPAEYKPTLISGQSRRTLSAFCSSSSLT